MAGYEETEGELDDEASGQTRAFWPDGRNYRRGMNVYTAPIPEG